MTENTQHGKIVAKRDGIYTIYVFQLDTQEYLMVTKLPNWGIYNLNIGDSGFITYQTAQAGETYYNRKTNSYQTYQYTGVYFKEFIKDRQELKDIIL